MISHKVLMPRPGLESPSTPSMILISLRRNVIRIRLSMLRSLPLDDRDVLQLGIHRTRD